MQLYGNEIWNNATPNSEKAVMVTEKVHLEVALKALDETGVNYCYYVKDNEVTIAFAKIAVQKSEIENLKKIPELSTLAIVPAKGNYTPKTSVIGNTAYKDIQNRHYQKLETDLALKVANELHQNGVHFSGRIYGSTTTITINSSGQQEFERIVRDVVNTRSRYQHKLENIDNIYKKISDIPDRSQVILKPIADMCYAKGEEFSNQFFFLLDEINDFTEEQLRQYTAEFTSIYAPLKDSEYLFADRTSLDRLKERLNREKLFSDITYLRGYDSAQKLAMQNLVNIELPESILNLIDYTFSPDDIQKIGDVWQDKERLSDAFDRIHQHIADVKGYKLSALQNYLRFGTYLPETAEFDRIKYKTDYYSTRENADGSIIYRVPIETNVGVLNRLAENGVIEEGLKNAHLTLESNGKEYNVILTLGENDVRLSSVDIFTVLTNGEQRVVLDVVNEVVRLEQAKQLAHEAGMPFSSKYFEGIDEEAPYVYDGTMSPEHKEKQLNMIEAAEQTDISEFSIPVEHEESAVVAEFRNKTTESFHLIGDRTEFDIELEVEELLRQEMIDSEIAGDIEAVVLYGSRSRGLETSEDTDIDVVVQINNAELKEDALFNLFSDMDIDIDGIPVDVNPIRPEETGTLDEYLPKAEAYLEQKQAKKAAQIFSSSVGENEKMGLEAPKTQEALIEEAKKRINDFVATEYDSEGADFSDLSNIDVAYTTTEDGKHEIQASVNLENNNIVKKVDGGVVEVEHYETLEALVDALNDLDFADLTYISDERIKELEERTTGDNDIKITSMTVEVEDEKVPKISGHNIQVGDRFEYNGIEFTVKSLQGDLPNAIRASYMRKDIADREYEVIANIDKDALAEQSAYLGRDEHLSDSTKDNRSGLEVPPDSISITIGESESSIIREIIRRAKNNEEPLSYGAVNGIFEYLDTKQHLERNDPFLKAGWYKKTDFEIRAVIDGEEFNYSGRFDIGDGEGRGGGSIADHIQAYVEFSVRPDNPFHLSEERLAEQQKLLDVFVPFLRGHEQITQDELYFINRIKSDYAVRITEDQLNSLVEKTVDFRYGKYVVDSVDVEKGIAMVRNARPDWHQHLIKADLSDIVDRNINLLLDEKGQFFRACDLPKLLAKSSLAWDEIESLGYIFYEQGYIDKFRPTSGAHYGNGGFAQPDVYDLARRYQSGEDISKELVKNLFETRRGTIPQTEIPFEDSYLEDLRLQISQIDTGYLVFYGGYSREVTFEEMAQAYLTYFKNELADIQKAVAEEEAHTNAQQTIKELGYEVDTEKDKFFFTPYGVEEIYYNPNSSEGGQFVISQISYEDILEAEAATVDIKEVVQQTTVFFEQLEGNSNQTAIDITSDEFGAYVERFNQPYDLEGGNTRTMYELTARAREQIEQRNNTAAPKQEQSAGTYKIYQIKSGDEYHYKRFEGFERQPEPVSVSDYDLVYEGSLADIDGDSINEKLEALFKKFNIDHPADFKGHSLSVSDVIVIENNGNQTAYFCDSVGYKELPDFFREIEQEQIINPSEQAEIETVEQKQESIQPKEDPTVSSLEESPQLSFDVTSTIPTRNKPENDITLDISDTSDNSEQEKAEAPKAENFHITDSEIGSGTPLQRFNNNLAAIRLLKDLEADGRQASPEEQETLSRYVGWGGLAEFFKESNPHYQELRDLLTEDEYSSARATTLDSFYTSPVIIDGIYTVLQNSGFEGGNILEPSMGIGNFFGRMPQEMQSQSKLFGVEIDSLTGRIAKQLYPDAHIDIKGFEKTSFKNGSFDVAVGNIPFGDFSLQYDRQSLKIHDYFFMQALDKVKDGGIVAFVTSKGTLDKRDSSFRRQLAEKADLIGAVRLPNTAFKTAGTEVTADIIFLQKRQSPPEKMPDWINIGVNENGLPINQYFIDNPEMVLGEIVQGNKMYGRNDDTMCIPFENSSLFELLPDAVSKIQATFNADIKAVVPMEKSEIEVPDGIRNYNYFEYKNNIYTIEDNEVVSLKDSWKRSYSPVNIERAKAYIQIRDTLRELLAVQQETKPDTDERVKELQTNLNTQYDRFYKKYGLMHSRFNSQLFRGDSSYPLMLSLEDKVDKDKLIRKSDIFYKRTIRVPEVVDKVDTPQEALVLSLSEKGKVDFEYMSALIDIPVKAIISDLKGDIFPVPELSHGESIVYQTASEYLSGDIYAKLSAARYASESNDIFTDNISALEAAIPTPLTAGEIDIQCGATWIPKEIYQQFMYEIFKTADDYRADIPPRYIWQQRGRRTIEIDYSPHTNKWNISNKSADRSVTTEKTFGTKIKNAYTIFEAVLNLHIPNITKTITDPNDPSKDKKVMDIEGTKLVKRKAEAIRKEFKEWIFRDPERRKMLVDLYNRQYNCIRPREYDGSHLQFHGMNASIELHQHQKNAIAHAIYGGNTLFAHCVGAGKTFEMIATAMESKRLGLCSKSLFVVPNHLTEQVGADFMKLYPNANILVATKQDFTKKNRSKLFAKIATGNYDAIIIGHSQLSMIPLSPERQERLYTEQINDITQGIAELKAQSGESFQVKAMERTRKSLKQKLEKLTSSKKDDTLYFEELGIDRIFVDEAHEFKNLMSVTKLQNVSGISGRTSQRATELFMKCQYLDEKTGGRGIVFATGTPVSNSVTELHTMMRYLQYDFLTAHGMQNFDNWVSVFGKQKTDYELAPTGDKFKVRTRIASYANMPELMTMFKQCADVRTSDSLKLPVPECELHIVNANPTDLQQKMVQELSARADDVQNGIVEPHEDNMLKITGDGRKVGLDPRLVNPELEDNPNTKLNQCVNNVFQIWQNTAADKMTQIIFCDLGVPKPNQTDNSKDSETDEKSMADIDSLEESGTFCVYDDIKSKLVEMGVPSKEIAFIHDAKTETQKSELFEKVRSGEVRVLLGSTAKMGTGTNVQDRLIALHDLDVPWRPSDLEQRRGRMVRQGNINEKVHLYRYVTKGTFDAYSYQLLETKQRFISQVITSKTPARTCSDVDQEALTYSEIKALCTGDERIKEKLTLDNRVKELQLFEKEYRDIHFELEDKVASYPVRREQMCGRIEKLEHDFEKCKAIPLDEENKPVFSMTIRESEYTDRKEAAEALSKALDVVYTDRDKSFPIGEIYGFKIFATYDHINECIRGIIKGELEYSIGLSTMPSVNVNKFEKLASGIGKNLNEARKKLAQADIDIESAKEILAQPFEYAQELAEKTERLSDLTDELNEEAAKRLQSTEKQPRTHYFGKGMILSSPKKEAPKQAQERTSEQENNKIKGAAI